MKIDLPYRAYSTLVHDGLAAIPVARRVQPYEYEIGVVVDGPRITLFTRASGGLFFAAHTVNAGGDIKVNGSGTFGIDTLPLRKIYSGRTVDQLPRSWVARQLCPPLVHGFDSAKMRVRLFTAAERPSGGSGVHDTLRVELYYLDTPSKDHVVTFGLAGTPLEEFIAPDTAECVLSIRTSVIKEFAQDFKELLKKKGAMFEVVRGNGSCLLSIRTPGLCSTAELLPGEYETPHGDLRVAIGGREVLAAAEGAEGLDFRVCRFADADGRAGRVRLSASGRIYDCACDWGGVTGTRGPISATPGTRPIILAKDEMRQAICLMSKGKSDKIRLRLHHDAAVLTLVSGSSVPPNRNPDRMATVDCRMPPSPGGVSSWCVATKGLLQVIQTMKGDRIKIYPADESISIVDFAEPFIRHRLDCVPPDDLGTEVENSLLALEADVGERQEVLAASPAER